MQERVITLCYRKIIDARSTQPWEQLVFKDTFTEYRMQAQFFDQEKQYRTFAALVQHVPAAEKLHFLVSAAAVNYIHQLHNKVPDIIDNLGRQFLSFGHFSFEIINSDLHDNSRHQVAVNFYSIPLVWHDTIGDYLLVSEKENGKLTHLFRLQPYLGIHSLEKT